MNLSKRTEILLSFSCEKIRKHKAEFIDLIQSVIILYATLHEKINIKYVSYKIFGLTVTS